MTRFDISDREALGEGGYRPGRDATHVAIPLVVEGASSPAEGRDLAERVGDLLSMAVDAIDGVRWVRSRGEAAFVLFTNLVTALAQLTPAERVALWAALPPGDRDRLRKELDR